MTRQLTSREKGVRDGRDSALLERPKKNPYPLKSDDWIDYEDGFQEGYEMEWQLLNH